MTADRVYNLLFLCTGNSAPSIFAESILNAEGKAARFLKNRILSFIGLPIASIDRLALETHLRQIGTMARASVRQSEPG